MDMATAGFSRYYDPGVKRRRIFESAHVDVGHEFILRLVALRLRSNEGRPGNKQERSERFKRDKNLIAQKMGYALYVDLPRDAKAFESRCSAIRKSNPRMSYSEIADAERKHNHMLCDQLFESIMEELDFYCPHPDEPERRRNLLRRMSGYALPFILRSNHF